MNCHTVICLLDVTHEIPIQYISISIYCNRSTVCGVVLREKFQRRLENLVLPYDICDNTVSIVLK